MLRLAKIAALISFTVLLNVATTLLLIQSRDQADAQAPAELEVTDIDNLRVKRLFVENALIVAKVEAGRPQGAAILMSPGHITVTAHPDGFRPGDGPAVQLRAGEGEFGEEASVTTYGSSKDGSRKADIKLSSSADSSNLLVRTHWPNENRLTGFQMYAAGETARFKGGPMLLDVIYHQSKDEKEEAKGE